MRFEIVLQCRYIYLEGRIKGDEREAHMGPYGIAIGLSKTNKIPLIGQINHHFFNGVTVFENNVFYTFCK